MEHAHNTRKSKRQEQINANRNMAESPAPVKHSIVIEEAENAAPFSNAMEVQQQLVVNVPLQAAAAGEAVSEPGGCSLKFADGFFSSFSLVRLLLSLSSFSFVVIVAVVLLL